MSIFLLFAANVEPYRASTRSHNFFSCAQRVLKNGINTANTFCKNAISEAYVKKIVVNRANICAQSALAAAAIYSVSHMIGSDNHTNTIGNHNTLVPYVADFTSKALTVLAASLSRENMMVLVGAALMQYVNCESCLFNPLSYQYLESGEGLNITINAKKPNQLLNFTVPDWVKYDSNISYVTDQKFLRLEISKNLLFTVNQNGELYIFNTTDKKLQFITKYKIPIFFTDSVQKIMVDNTKIYLMFNSPGLIILDIKNLLFPKIWGQYDPNNHNQAGTSIFLDEDIIFATFSLSGLKAINISDQKMPLVGSFVTDGYASSVFVKKPYAYVADAYRGFKILDISNLSNIKQINAYTKFYADEIKIYNNLAIVFAKSGNVGGVRFYNIKNPYNVTLINTIQDIGIWNAFFQGGLAFFTTLGQQKLYVYNITNPLQISRFSEYTFLHFLFDSIVTNNTLFATDVTAEAKAIRIVDLENGFLLGNLGAYYNGAKYNLLIEGKDCSDSAGVEIGREPRKLDISFNPYAYINQTYNHSISSHFIDINPIAISVSTTNNQPLPLWLDFKIVPELLFAYKTNNTIDDVATNGNLIFICDREKGSLVLESKNFTILGSVPNCCKTMTLIPSILNMIVGVCDNHQVKGFKILNAYDPRYIKELGTYLKPNLQKFAFIYEQQVAFTIDDVEGLDVVDVVYKENPKWLNTYAINKPLDLILITPYLYILTSEGLGVFDVSNSRNQVTLLNFYSSSLPIRAFALYNDIAYLNHGKDGLTQLNVTDPLDIQLKNSRSVTKSLQKISVSNGLLFAQTDKEITVFDVNNLDHVLTTYNTSSDASFLYTLDNQVYTDLLQFFTHLTQAFIMTGNNELHFVNFSNWVLLGSPKDSDNGRYFLKIIAENILGYKKIFTETLDVIPMPPPPLEEVYAPQSEVTNSPPINEPPLSSEIYSSELSQDLQNSYNETQENTFTVSQTLSKMQLYDRDKTQIPFAPTNNIIRNNTVGKTRTNTFTASATRSNTQFYNRNKTRALFGSTNNFTGKNTFTINNASTSRNNLYKEATIGLSVVSGLFVCGSGGLIYKNYHSLRKYINNFFKKGNRSIDEIQLVSVMRVENLNDEIQQVEANYNRNLKDIYHILNGFQYVKFRPAECYFHSVRDQDGCKAYYTSHYRPEKKDQNDQIWLNNSLTNYTDLRVLVKESKDWPNCIHGQMHITYPNGIVKDGSGVLIGPYHFLTCAHNVCFENNSKPRDIDIYFGCYNDSQLDHVKGVGFYMYELYKINDAKNEYDIALVILSKKMDHIGWAGLMWQHSNEFSDGKKYEIGGYPHDKDNKVRQMWKMDGKITYTADEFLYHKIHTALGQSGAGIILKLLNMPMVVGVHTDGALTQHGYNRGARISEEKFFRIVQKWIREKGEII